MRVQPFFPFMAFACIALSLSQAMPAFAADELPPARRLVTVTGHDGKTRILADGPSANAVTLNGSRINRLWESGPVPVALPPAGDAGQNAGNAYRPGFSGTSLYTADLPPGIEIGLHQQQSLDYIAVLEGEVDLLLEQGPVKLKRGDILVQAANLHGWANRGHSPARILVVVMTAAQSASSGSISGGGSSPPDTAK